MSINNILEERRKYWDKVYKERLEHDMFHISFYDETCPYCLEDTASGYKDISTGVRSD